MYPILKKCLNADMQMCGLRLQLQPTEATVFDEIKSATPIDCPETAKKCKLQERLVTTRFKTAVIWFWLVMKIVKL